MVVEPSNFQDKILAYLKVADLNDLVLYRTEERPNEK
jgi:hypothetical protein